MLAEKLIENRILILADVSSSSKFPLRRTTSPYLTISTVAMEAPSAAQASAAAQMSFQEKFDLNDPAAAMTSYAQYVERNILIKVAPSNQY